MADRVVSMSRSKIEHIGTPQETYRTPRTGFVADFLGSSNPFTGSVNAVPDKVIGEKFVGATAAFYVETPGGQEIRVRKGHDELTDLPLAIGQPQYALWSPEDAHLVAEV
jgi:spermidine/putrescine transport system ATP-binding protein